MVEILRRWYQDLNSEPEILILLLFTTYTWEGIQVQDNKEIDPNLRIWYKEGFCLGTKAYVQYWPEQTAR